MTTLLLVAAAVLICIGGLLGASWTTQMLETVSRRHAAERRVLDEAWRALEASRHRQGQVRCAHCDRRLTGSGWLLVVEPPYDEEDDGT